MSADDQVCHVVVREETQQVEKIAMEAPVLHGERRTTRPGILCRG